MKVVSLLYAFLLPCTQFRLLNLCFSTLAHAIATWVMTY